jgi:hypothetical protein
MDRSALSPAQAARALGIDKTYLYRTIKGERDRCAQHRWQRVSHWVADLEA